MRYLQIQILSPIEKLLSLLGGAVAILCLDQARAAEWRGSSSDRPTVADWSGGYLGVEGSAGDAYGSFNFDAGSVERRSVPAFRSGDSTGRSDQGRN
ncbi:hypothetical protein, partial [Burkholderia cenocepacia]